MSKSLIVWVIAFALSVGLLIFSVLKVASLTNETEDTTKQMECVTDAQVESVECHEYLGIPMPAEFTSEDMGSVYMITDNLTGCQYISSYRGGITPRMYSDGIQVCGQSTYPNGEHDGHLSD